MLHLGILLSLGAAAGFQDSRTEVALHPRPTSRYALGFYGLLRTFVLDAVQQNINATLIAPNDEDGGIDVYWHLYADDRKQLQRRALDRIRADPRTAGLVVEPWRLGNGEASSWGHRRRLNNNAGSSRDHRNLVDNSNNAWHSLPLPEWVVEELQRDHPLIKEGLSYSGSANIHEAGTLSHWRKKKLVSEMIHEGARRLQKQRGENHSTSREPYSVVALARSDLVYPVARGEPLPVLFRHFETPSNDEDVVVVPEKGDYNRGLHDMFVAGSRGAVSKYSDLYAALPGMAANKTLPTARGNRIRGSRNFQQVTRFDSEALLQTHLHRKKIRIARTPLLMTAVRTDEFMKHAKIRYNPTSIAQVLATEGFPAACAPSLWSLVAGSQAECPRCCTQGETEEALQAANETRNASPMRNTSSGPSAPRNVCWGAGFWAGFSYTGVEMEAERGGACACRRRLDCDLCTPISAVVHYRCAPLRGMYCVHSNFNHRRHPAKESCPPLPKPKHKSSASDEEARRALRSEAHPTAERAKV